jgi:hypothetical protein
MFDYGGKKRGQVRWRTGQSVVLIRDHDNSNHLRKMICICQGSVNLPH